MSYRVNDPGVTVKSPDFAQKYSVFIGLGLPIL